MPQSKGPCLSSEPCGSRRHRKFSPAALTPFLPACRPVTPTHTPGCGGGCALPLSVRLGLLLGAAGAKANGPGRRQQGPAAPCQTGQALLPQGPCCFVRGWYQVLSPPPTPHPWVLRLMSMSVGGWSVSHSPGPSPGQSSPVRRPGSRRHPLRMWEGVGQRPKRDQIAYVLEEVQSGGSQREGCLQEGSSHSKAS